MKKETTENSRQFIDQTYMEILIKLRQIIAEEYTDGGWFPSGRVMCARLNVNRITYAKALSRLTMEGIARNVPRKGTYIKPNNLRTKKIGIVINNGEDSPFVSMAKLFHKIIGELIEHNISFQLIQANQPEILPKKAVLHCVNGLIWLYNQASSLNYMEEVHKNGLVPSLAIQYFDPKSDEDIPPATIPVLSMDYHYISECRIKAIVAAGHKKVAYAGNYWFAQFSGFCEALNKKHLKLDENLCFSDQADILKRLKKIIKEENITAIYSEGDYMDSVFQVINTLPTEQQPELYLRHYKEEALHDLYPDITNINVEHTHAANIGKKAVKMMADHIQNGTPLQSCKLKPDYKLTRL